MPPDGRGSALRAAAARMVAGVVRDGRALPTSFDVPEARDARDRALLRAIVTGTIRWHHRLEWLSRHLLSRALGAGDAELAALIRVGLFQLAFLRVPDHAAVSATVEASRCLGRDRARGLVNAVLRRYLREKARLGEALQAVREAKFSHPDWLIEAIASDWPEEVDAILEAGNAEPPMWLRVNARRLTRDEYLARLRREGIAAQAHAELPAAVVLEEPRPVDALPGYAAGDVSVQDGAAQYAAGFLQPAPGDRVLDACAAPGGKAAHLLEAFAGIGELCCLDRDAQRLAALSANLARLGLEATVIEADAKRRERWWDGRVFERILLDAPCSALGVIRRHPDIKLLRRPADLERAAQTQRALLDALWPALAKGGRLLYVTCTVMKKENAAQIGRFVDETPDAAISPIAAAPDFQRLPGEANMDGFYYACVTKQDAR